MWLARAVYACPSKGMGRKICIKFAKIIINQGPRPKRQAAYAAPWALEAKKISVAEKMRPRQHKELTQRPKTVWYVLH